MENTPPPQVEYMVTTRNFSISENHQAVVALQQIGYMYSKQVKPLIEPDFCGPDMNTYYLSRSISTSDLCLFGFIPSSSDTKLSKTHIHSVLTFNFVGSDTIKIDALCVNNVRKYSGAGKLLMDVISIARKNHISRLDLDAIQTKETLDFYNKYWFTASPSDKGHMTRTVKPAGSEDLLWWLDPTLNKTPPSLQSSRSSPLVTHATSTKKAPRYKTVYKSHKRGRPALKRIVAKAPRNLRIEKTPRNSRIEKTPRMKIEKTPRIVPKKITEVMV
jgi:hypothetical protein